jgi:aminodeoxyfutalosine synthase
MVTPFLSQIALSFGCDDVEGTVVYERIYHEAGAHTAMHLPYMDLVGLIRGAGKRPVERDSLYQAVRESFEDPPPEPSLRRGAALPVVHAA